MKKPSAAFLPIGTGVGVAVGVALGTALDNLALGIGLGIAMGTGLGLAMMGLSAASGENSRGADTEAGSESSNVNHDAGDAGAGEGGGSD